MNKSLRRVSRRIVVFVTLMCCFSSVAAMAELAAAFAKHPSYGMARLSPDGKHLALYVDADSTPSVAVLEVDTKKPISLIEFTRERVPGNIQWANNERLIISMARRIGSADVPVPTGELFAINMDGKRGKNIFGYQAEELDTPLG